MTLPISHAPCFRGRVQSLPYSACPANFPYGTWDLGPVGQLLILCSKLQFLPTELWTVSWTLRGSQAQDIMYTEWRDDWSDSSCSQFYTIYSFVHYVSLGLFSLSKPMLPQNGICTTLCQSFSNFTDFHHHLRPLFKMMISGASLVVQWLGVFLSMQGTSIQSLVQEDSTCHRELSLWTTTMDTVCCNYWSQTA